MGRNGNLAGWEWWGVAGGGWGAGEVGWGVGWGGGAVGLGWGWGLRLRLGKAFKSFRTFKTCKTFRTRSFGPLYKF